MKITHTDGPPDDLLYFDEELDLNEKHVEDIAEIFNTPLTGAYNWDLRLQITELKDSMN